MGTKRPKNLCHSLTIAATAAALPHCHHANTSPLLSPVPSTVCVGAPLSPPPPAPLTVHEQRTAIATTASVPPTAHHYCCHRCHPSSLPPCRHLTTAVACAFYSVPLSPLLPVPLTVCEQCTTIATTTSASNNMPRSPPPLAPPTVHQQCTIIAVTTGTSKSVPTAHHYCHHHQCLQQCANIATTTSAPTACCYHCHCWCPQWHTFIAATHATTFSAK